MLFVQSANMRHATTPQWFSPQAPRATKSATVNLWIRQEGLVQDSRFLRYAVVTVRREQLVLSRCRQHLHDQTTITSSFHFTQHFHKSPEPQEAQCPSVCLPQTKVETREERLLKAKYAVAAHSMALPPLLGRYALIQAAGLSILLGIYAKDQLDNLTSLDSSLT